MAIQSKNYTVVLGQYKGLTRPAIDTTPTEEEIDTFLSQEQQKHVEMLAVDRPAANGDTVVIDFAGFADGVQFEGGTAENYSLVLGSGSFIPGFEEQLIGAAAGSEVDVNVTFPEQYHSADLAGKPALFKCTVHTVQEQKLPEVDDRFASEYYHLENLAALREAVRQALSARMAEGGMRQLQAQLVQQIVDASQIRLEDAFLEHCLDQVMKTVEQEFAQQGFTLEQVCQFSGMDTAALREQFRPQAEQSGKSTAVLTAIAYEEGLTVANGDLEAELDRMAEAYELDPAEMRKHISEENRDAIREGMLASRALKLVLDSAVEA